MKQAYNVILPFLVYAPGMLSLVLVGDDFPASFALPVNIPAYYPQATRPRILGAGGDGEDAKDYKREN